MNPAPKVYPKTSDPGTTGVEVNVQTNVFGLEITKKIELFQYVVHIKTDLTPTKEVVFTKKGKEDFVVVDRHQKCCAIFSHAVQKFNDFFKINENCLVYDGQSILFSTLNLFTGLTDSESKTKLMQINGAELNNPDLKNLQCIKTEVYLSKNPSIILSIEALAQRTANTNLEANNRAYQQILELSLYQSCIRNTSKGVCFEHGKLFFIRPFDEGFIGDDCVDVGDGKHMLPGIKRMVQFIEGPFGRNHNNPAVVIDAMKVAFHKEQSVLEKISEILQKNSQNGLQDFEREKCIPVIKGLDCFSTYTGRIRHLKIEGIHQLGATIAHFQLKDGKTCTVATYFEDRYKIKLQYPNANLLICKDRGNQNMYPMELMTITKNQRVTIAQQTSSQSQKTTKESAVMPDVRQRLIMTGKNAADISSENKTLSQLGVSVCSEPLVAKGRLLPPNKICVPGANTVVKSGKWRFSRLFTRPAEDIKVWAMYAVGTHTTRFSKEHCRKFSYSFIDECEKKGIRFGQPTELKLVYADQIEKKLETAGQNNCSFVFVLTDDCITNLHQKYKMIERKYQMVVQDMKISKASSVVLQGKKLTLENVINKTNVKLGGTNYTVTDGKFENILIIGVGFSVPTKSSRYNSEGEWILSPLVIGYSSNGKADQEFTGDFVLWPSGQDTIASIEEIMTQNLELYQKSRNKLPEKILVYRSGASEGTHGAIISHEIPLARAAMERFSSEMKLIYLVVSKDHAYRFFKNDLGTYVNDNASASSITGGSQTSSGRADEMNVPPGLVLDTIVTHPACKQFFLNSHTTLQGTAKTPLYTILADDCNANLSILENITYTLCHNHQIVGLSTSLPTPLYVANEYAKRGRNLFIERSNASPVMSGARSDRDVLDEVTDQISYRKAGVLIERRVNA